MTRKSNSFKNIITVLMALLLIGIAAAPASAALNATKGAGSIVVAGVTAQGALTSANETTALQIAGPASQIGGSIFIDLPSGSGVTYNITGSTPAAVFNNSVGSNNAGLSALSASVTSSTRLTISVTNLITSPFWAINVSGIKVDVASTATAGNKVITVDTGFASDSTAVLTVAKPTVNQINLVNIPFGAGNATVPANIINISTTLGAVGEIGAGTFINLTLPSGTGLTFATNNPGNVTFVGTAGANNISNVSSDGLTLSTVVSNVSTGTAVTYINFTGFGLNATTTAVNGTVAFNVTLGNSSTSAYTQAVSNKINLTKPNASVISQINLPLGNVNVSVPTNAINITVANSGVAGEIGNGSFINITLPAGVGITFSTAINGSGNVTINTTRGGDSGSTDLNGSTVANVTSDGLTLYAKVGVNASTTKLVYIDFTGFTLNATTTAVNGTKFNLTTTPMNASGSVTTQIALGINTTNVSLNLAGTATSNTIYFDANGNTTASLGILYINTTSGVKGEIGNETNITIALPSYTGVTINTSSRAVVTSTVGNVTSTTGFVFNFSGINNYAIPAVVDTMTLTVKAYNGSNETQSVIAFSGYKLNVTSAAPAGRLNFSVTTTANGTNNGTGASALTQNFNWGFGITIQPVLADVITNFSSNTNSMPGGNTSTFNFKVTNLSTGMNFSGATVSFGVNTSAASLSTASATTDTYGNVSVNVTAPGALGGFNLTVNITGPAGFVNATNRSINVTIQSTSLATASKLAIITDTAKIAPSQKANITVVAADIYGNNVSGYTNSILLQASSTNNDATVSSTNPVVMVNGIAYFNLSKTTAGSVSLTATDQTGSLTFANATQVFTVDPVSVTLTAASPSVSNASADNLTATLRDASGNAIPTPGQSITITSSNTTLGGINSATASSVTATTNSSGFATANFTANSAGITGTAFANASYTNASGYILRSNVSISVILGTLTVSASPTTVTVGTATNVVFTVTSSGSAVSGATVTLSGAGVSTNGTTDANGSATISVNATSVGTITVTATATGYTSGTASITASTVVTAPALVSSITPNSRNAQLGTPVTLFMSVINYGTATATGVSVAQASSLPVTVSYTPWNGTAFTGSANTPVDIAAGGTANFVLAINATSAFSSSSLTFNVSGTNVAAAPISGVNTLTISANATPLPDVIMISTTLNVSTAVNTATTFAVATSNVGANATGVSLNVVVPSSITGLAYQVNQTNPTTGAIIGPATGLTINAGAQPTFAVFLQPTQSIAFDPTNNRITLQLVDGTGRIIGAQSVAISTT